MKSGPEMEKRPDTADISVLLFSGCANILAVHAKIAEDIVLLALC